MSASKIAQAIIDLFAVLDPLHQGLLLQDLGAKLRPISAPRAGTALTAVLDAMPYDCPWDVKGLRMQIRANGVSLSDKEIYNAIGYLTRKRHIHRFGHGRYTALAPRDAPPPPCDDRKD